MAFHQYFPLLIFQNRIEISHYQRHQWLITALNKIVITFCQGSNFSRSNQHLETNRQVNFCGFHENPTNFVNNLTVPDAKAILNFFIISPILILGDSMSPFTDSFALLSCNSNFLRLLHCIST